MEAPILKATSNAFDLMQAARLAYIQKHAAMSRADLLHLCRVGGISAGRIKHNYHLANLLWEHFGLPAYRAVERGGAGRRPCGL